MARHSKTKEKPVKKKKTGLKVFIFILILLACAGVWFAKRVNDLDGNWIAALLGHNVDTVKNLEEIKLLLMGESEGMSDTIIVCSYNPQTRKNIDAFNPKGYACWNRIWCK